MTTDKKTCPSCGETKSFDEFGKNRSRRDGAQAHCKECRARYRRENRDKIAAKDRAYYAKNRGRILEQQSEYYQENREKRRATQRAYRDAHREEIAARKRAYYEANRDEIADHNREYYQANRDRIAERGRAYYEANRDRHAEWGRAYREANRDEIAAYARAYREANRDKLAAYYEANKGEKRVYNKAYRGANPHRYWAISYRARARKFGFEPVVEDFTKADVIEMWGDSCFYCESGAFEELDHWIPVSQGSPHTLAAVRPSCSPCNRSKSDTPGDEWEAEQERLDNLTPDELNAEIDAEIARWSTP